MQTEAPKSASPASPKNAPESLPVVCFKNPMMLGPKKPPLVPIELTSAIPTAAEDPLRSFVGTHQNEVLNIGLPTCMTTKAMTRGIECGSSATPIPPTQ
jgi:hypothetical protein